MDRVYRNKVSLGVAFKSSWKRSYTSPVALNDEAPDVVVAGELKRSESKLKSALRPFAGFFFKLLRPLILPIAFRARRFFVEEFREEIRSEMIQLRQHSQETLEEIRRSVQTSEDTANQRARRLSAELNSIADRVSNAGKLTNVISDRVSDAGQLANAISDRLINLDPRLKRIEEYTALSARRVAVNSGPDNLLVKTNVGYVLCPATDHALVGILLEQGELEVGTRLLIERLLSPGDTFIDAGANIGLHTLAAGRAMNGRGKILAFEPYGPTKQLLERTIWLNGFSSITTVCEAAVTDRIGVANFFLGATSGHHSLFSLSEDVDTLDSTVEVNLLTLDKVFEDVRLKSMAVNLIKIDVEGAELEVLEGAKSIIDRNKDVALIVEFGASHLKRTRVEIAHWFSKFTEKGFIYQAIDPDTGVLQNLSLAELEATNSTNLFFARRNSTAWLKAGAIE